MKPTTFSKNENESVNFLNKRSRWAWIRTNWIWILHGTFGMRNVVSQNGTRGAFVTQSLERAQKKHYACRVEFATRIWDWFWTFDIKNCCNPILSLNLYIMKNVINLCSIIFEHPAQMALVDIQKIKKTLQLVADDR